MEFMGMAAVTVISVICYLVGEAVKLSPLDNKWIPLICGVAGAALGIAGMHSMANFPAQDVLSALAVGHRKSGVSTCYPAGKASPPRPQDSKSRLSRSLPPYP